MQTQETPERTIILEGYKLIQFQIHIQNELGKFLLNPIFPSQKFISDYFKKYEEAFSGNEASLLWVKEAMGKQARHVSIKPFSELFEKNNYLTKNGGKDSYFDFVKWRMTQMINPLGGLKRELTTTDKLQLVFQTLEMQPLPKVYFAAIKAIDNKDAGNPPEIAYLDFLDAAMNEFEELLKRNIGGKLGIYEINLFKILYRKQAIFSNRILSYDLDRIFVREDLEMDKILTSLLVLGWGIELEGPYYKRSSTEIRILAEQFLKLYLSAQIGKITYRREDETKKKKTYRNSEFKEFTFSKLSYEDEDGNQILTDDVEQKLISDEPEPIEKLKDKESYDRILDKLSLREKKITELLADGYIASEIAVKLKISEPYISKVIKSIKIKLEKS